MRRRRARTVVRSFALSATAAVGLLCAGSVAARTTRPPTLAQNQAAATADAAKLISEVPLPAGAQRLSAEPAGDNGYLTPLSHLVATTIGVVDTRWWQVGGETPAQVVQTVVDSPLPGTTQADPSAGGNVKTGTSDFALDIFLSDVPERLDGRMVEVTATTLSDGDTGIMVQSQSVWVVPRPAASLVPAGTHVISLQETTAAGTVLGSATLTATPRVRSALGYFNALETVQPFTVSCGAETAGPPPDLVTVRFLARRNATTALATATFGSDFSEPGSGTSDACDPVALRVGRSGPTDLLGGEYVAALNRLFDTRITTG